MPSAQPHGVQGSTLRGEGQVEVSYKSYRRGRASGFAATHLPQWLNCVARELFHVASGPLGIIGSSLVPESLAVFSIHLSDNCVEGYPLTPIDNNFLRFDSAFFFSKRKKPIIGRSYCDGSRFVERAFNLHR